MTGSAFDFKLVELAPAVLTGGEAVLLGRLGADEERLRASVHDEVERPFAIDPRPHENVLRVGQLVGHAKARGGWAASLVLARHRPEWQGDEQQRWQDAKPAQAQAKGRRSIQQHVRHSER